MVLASLALNVSAVAAWRIHCHVEVSKMSHLDFHRETTLCLLKSSKVHKQNGVAVGGDFPNDIRFDGIGHMRQSAKQGRCKICQKNTRVMYSKCGVCGVCFHSEENAVCF